MFRYYESEMKTKSQLKKMKLGALFFGATLGREHFSGNKVFRITIKSVEELRIFEELSHGFDVWKQPKTLGDTADIHIPSDLVEIFTEKLDQKNLFYKDHIGKGSISN